MKIKTKINAILPLNIFAVFAVAKVGDKFCAVTDENGIIRGLPGGKIDPTDIDIFDACVRESAEEGWNLLPTGEILQLTMVDGKLVAWLKCNQFGIISNHKEKSRGIMPTLAYASQLKSMGNDFLSLL